jgi:hypothetical protein
MEGPFSNQILSFNRGVMKTSFPYRSRSPGKKYDPDGKRWGRELVAGRGNGGIFTLLY